MDRPFDIQGPDKENGSDLSSYHGHSSPALSLSDLQPRVSRESVEEFVSRMRRDTHSVLQQFKLQWLGNHTCEAQCQAGAGATSVGSASVQTDEVVVEAVKTARAQQKAHAETLASLHAEVRQFQQGLREEKDRYSPPIIYIYISYYMSEPTIEEKKTTQYSLAHLAHSITSV